MNEHKNKVKNKKVSPPGYISSEEAASRLNVTKDRLYQWIKEGRLASYTIGNAFILLEKDVANFERNPTGRKRKAPPAWRIYKGEVRVQVTEIHVPVLAGKQEELESKIEAMYEANQFIFPGTFARYIMRGDEQTSYVKILLFWKNTEMPTEEARQSHMDQFQAYFADVLDWPNARVKTTGALTYT